MPNTLKYYNINARQFFEDTNNVEFGEMQDIFLNYLQEGDYILDFGCGSGRDSKEFIDRGFRVDSVDGSEELCKLAEQNIGQSVTHMLFQELSKVEKYEGIWACSSILHLDKISLIDVFKRMSRALKENGYIYSSFKYGTLEGERNGRYFTDLTEEVLKELLIEIPELKVVETLITKDVRPGRDDEKWLNVILRKTR